MALKVALLGLGTMGSGMARNMLKSGLSLTVWNRTADKAEALRNDGANIAETPAKAAAGADIVLSMLADDDASRAVWLGEEGTLAAMQAGATAIDCGTVSPDWIRELLEAAGSRGIKVIDAPVTGSRPQAEVGQLTFLAGADIETLERARPVLETMSKEILHLGPVGSGVQMKLVNNYLCGVQVASFAEGLAWIERNGLNRDVALSFLNRAAPGSPLINAMSERMTKRTYEMFFLLRLMAKDMRYAREAAAHYDVPLRTGEAAEALFAEAELQGHAEQDMASVAEIFRK